MSIRFYDVDENYTDYLRKIESRIPHISYGTNDKFLCGIVLKINDFNYYAPISSFRQRQFTNIPIIHNNQIIGTIRFSYMFPCPDDVLIEKDFSQISDLNYRNLLIDEWNFCNREETKIKKKAEYIYKRYLSGHDSVLQNHCCNFKILEDMCLKYESQ